MSAVVLLLFSIAVLLVGYVTYGKWLAEQWGIDEKKVTPSHEFEDGLDYCPAKEAVLNPPPKIKKEKKRKSDD